MPKLKFVNIIYLFVLLFWGTDTFSQTYSISNDKIIFTTIKQVGIGPSGNQTYFQGTVDQYSESEKKGFPQIKNKPQNLKNIVECFYILNNFQFYYQNYRAGIFSKNLFLEKTVQHKWNLKDTVTLSTKPIRCVISLLAGFNEANDVVYIVDANNNGDFGDDVIKPLPLAAIPDINIAIPVQIDYLAGKNIKVDKILVYPVYYDNKGKINPGFMFPEFKYARLNYQGHLYFICTDVFQQQPTISVLPDVPNFSSASFANRIKLDQFIKIGNTNFKFSGYEQNGNKIILTADKLQNFLADKRMQTRAYVSTSAEQSSQVGFEAPEIKGYNINDNVKNLSFISTTNLKGKYILIDFWGTFCAPCIAEFPYLKEVYLKYGRNKFEIIGILDERDKNVTDKLIKEGVMIWPNIKMNAKGTELKGYNINGYPTNYLIDPVGKIIAINLRGNELTNKLKSLIKY